MNTLKSMVENNKKVFFKYYRDGELWYATECNFLFPVPTNDVGNGTFLNEDRAVLFMRWLRKYIEASKAALDL